MDDLLNHVPKGVEDAILKHWDENQKISYNKIGKYFGIHPDVISKFLRKNGRRSVNGPSKIDKDHSRQPFRYLTDKEADEDLAEWVSEQQRLTNQNLNHNGEKSEETSQNYEGMDLPEE